MEMQAYHPCHGSHQQLINHLRIHILKNASKSYSKPKISVKTKGQRLAPKVKVDLTSSMPKEEKQGKKPNISTNKHGPKAIWVLIQK